MQSLEQEINERKAEHQSSAQATTITPNKQSKLSNALDKLLCKRDKEQQAQQQRQIISDDVPTKSVANLSAEDKLEAVDMETEPEIVNDERHSDSNSTNKFELEFVNNMPKPPSPKSSLIFSPPPSSLSIDKRDASIFDFADNFSIPNDSSVSLLTFNPDNIFKEDSAKETMDLVANLRQNIKKGGKHDDNNKTKTEPTANQSQVIEIDTSPDSTTMDTNSNQKVEEDNKRAIINPAIQSATLVIDLEQENSGDESKSSNSSHVQQPKPPQINENNWMPNAMMNTNTNNMVQPMQLQTEVEKMASKMQSSNEIIPTPADILMANEMNEQQNANTFHIQPPYVNNSYNGGMSPSRQQQQQPSILDQKKHSHPIKNDRVTIRHRRDLMGDDNPRKFTHFSPSLFSFKYFISILCLYVFMFSFHAYIYMRSVRERTFTIHAK